MSGVGGAGGPGDPGEAALMLGRVLAAAGQVSLPVVIAAAAAVVLAGYAAGDSYQQGHRMIGQGSLALAATVAVLAAAAWAVRRRRRTAGDLPLRDAGEAHREPGKLGSRDG